MLECGNLHYLNNAAVKSKKNEPIKFKKALVGFIWQKLCQIKCLICQKFKLLHIKKNKQRNFGLQMSLIINQYICNFMLYWNNLRFLFCENDCEFWHNLRLRMEQKYFTSAHVKNSKYKEIICIPPILWTNKAKSAQGIFMFAFCKHTQVRMGPFVHQNHRLNIISASKIT